MAIFKGPDTGDKRKTEATNWTAFQELWPGGSDIQLGSLKESKLPSIAFRRFDTLEPNYMNEHRGRPVRSLFSTGANFRSFSKVWLSRGYNPNPATSIGPLFYVIQACYSIA
jgi:hypothetical protein